MRTLIALVSLVLVVGGAGCAAPARPGPDGGDGSDQDGGSDADDGGDLADPDDDLQGGPLTLAARAVDGCGSWTPIHQPGVNHQTPFGLKAGVLSVALMRSHRDAQAVDLSLAAPIVEVDLDAGGLLFEGDTRELPAGTYTHVRVGLASSAYSVMGTAHAGMVVPGQVEIAMALANHQDADGLIHGQGQYTATFSAYGQSQSTSGQTPLNCVLSIWGGIADTANGHFLVTVPIPGGPLVIDHQGGDPVRIDLDFPVRDAFGWRDLDEPGFADGVFDLALTPGGSELPDALPECNLFMADRCQGEALASVHPAWPMPDSATVFFSDGTQLVDGCPAEGAPAHGQDGCSQVNPPDYAPDGEVVRDLVTGLLWQRQVPPGSLDWWQARDYCHGLSLGGRDDWRLPSRVELVSILDYSRVDPTIDVQAFPGTPPEFFWSGSPVPFSNLAYGVRFELGFIYDHDPYGSGRVRCVAADAGPPELRFDLGAEVVSDRATGLDWQAHRFEAPMIWLDALAACEGLELAGHDDWRLPTLKETQSLVDGRRMQPSIDVQAFPDTPPEWFWSSTPIAWPPDQGWATSYTDGYASIHDFDELHRVRCVRLRDE